jgi:hypothetical protein
MMAPQFDEGVLKYRFHPLHGLSAAFFEPLRYLPRDDSVRRDHVRASHRRRCIVFRHVHARNIEVSLPSLA